MRLCGALHTNMAILACHHMGIFTGRTTVFFKDGRPLFAAKQHKKRESDNGLRLGDVADF